MHNSMRLVDTALSLSMFINKWVIPHQCNKYKRLAGPLQMNFARSLARISAPLIVYCSLKKGTFKFKTCSTMRFDLAGLYEYTYTMYIIILIYLSSSPAAYILKRIPCFKDLCERGVQYCVAENNRRCYYCKDVVENCGTDEMPLQCDAFCRDKEAIERERKLNKTLEVYTNNTNGEFYIQGYEISTYVLAGFVVLLVMIIIGLVLYIVLRKRTQIDASNKGQDIEKAPLITDADNQHQNHADKTNRDILNASEAEAEAQTDVSLQDEVKRDSIGSDDSAMGSLPADDEIKKEEVGHYIDDSVPKMELGEGQNKHGRPTQENVANVNKDELNNGLQKARGLNPTKGENDETFELAINYNPSPFLKTYKR